jgi:NADH-quinone oxidoreductase subunit F
VENNPPIDLDLTPLRNYLQSVADRGRTMLLPALHHAQSLYGWLSRAVLTEISKALRVPAADVHGVVEFYSMFYNHPTAKRVVRFCEDPACSLAGADDLIKAAQERLSDEIDAGQVTFEKVPCLGMCEFAPAALDGERPGGDLRQDVLPAFLDGSYTEPKAKVYGEPLWLLGRVGRVDPTSIEDFTDHGGFAGLDKALTMSPDELIAEVEAAGLLGRGGAMFPLGRKWRFTRDAPGTPADKHIVVNADESEPGTFKDRVLLEEDPFAVIEATILAGYAVGAENGWIFVRGEYPRAYNRLAEAVRQCRETGRLGRDIRGKEGFYFEIEVRLGAGAYICGEETALFEAIEGKRGFPRIKPPFPVTHGLFQQPTAINNVETLVGALAALEMGIETWKSVGTEGSPGTKLFCLSGHVARPGVYETPFGLTIAELIELAGGVPGGRAIQAVLMGGAAGKFIGPDELDMPLTYEDARELDIPLGSGVVQVFDETADLSEHLYELARFFAHESCGKCFPCQLGTQRQVEILGNIAHNGGPTPADKTILLDVGHAMTQTSLCGLGQTAASAVVSAIERWPEFVEPPTRKA